MDIAIQNGDATPVTVKCSLLALISKLIVDVNITCEIVKVKQNKRTQRDTLQHRRSH